MIDYPTYQRIQHLHHVEKLTVTQIAHAVAMDARTVRRWLDEPHFRARATPCRRLCESAVIRRTALVN